MKSYMLLIAMLAASSLEARTLDLETMTAAALKSRQLEQVLASNQKIQLKEFFSASNTGLDDNGRTSVFLTYKDASDVPCVVMISVGLVNKAKNGSSIVQYGPAVIGNPQIGASCND